mgnify:CR=1 FL=1
MYYHIVKQEGLKYKNLDASQPIGIFSQCSLMLFWVATITLTLNSNLNIVSAIF